MLFVENLIQASLIFNGLRGRHCQRALLVYHYPRLGIERCGKINAVNSGSESWTGIGVVAGCAAVWLITQGPHVKDMAMYERITFLHILQEVRSIGKTCNQLLLKEGQGRLPAGW